jgi:hypothetical protein
MSDPDGYPPPDQPPQARPPADQPPPGQTAQAGQPAARPPWQPPDPYRLGPPAGQPPGPPYPAWPAPDPYQAGPPATPLPPWTSAAPPPSWSPPTAGQPTLWPPPPPPAGRRHRPLAGQTAALTVLLAAIAVADLAASVAASLSRIVWGSVEFGELLDRRGHLRGNSAGVGQSHLQRAVLSGACVRGPAGILGPIAGRRLHPGPGGYQYRQRMARRDFAGAMYAEAPGGSVLLGQLLASCHGFPGKLRDK